MLWLARSDPVPANASAAQGLWQLGNCVFGPSAVKHVMGHLGEASGDVRHAAAAATAAALEVSQPVIIEAGSAIPKSIGDVELTDRKQHRSMYISMQKISAKITRQVSQPLNSEACDQSSDYAFVCRGTPAARRRR